MRKETGNTQIFAPIELEKKGARQMITVILFRPLRMFLFEPIVLFSCLYLSYAYAIFCKLHWSMNSCSHVADQRSLDLFFTAYPIIFSGKNQG